MYSTFDCIVIGAGHNGLVCATYLARAGKRVLVVEAADQVGGAAATHEFAPGFRVSSAAHLLHLMPASVVSELGLEQHGLRLAGRDLPTYALGTDGRHVELSDKGVAAASPEDAPTYAAFIVRMRRLAGALAPMLGSAPPRLGTDAWSDRISLLKLGWQIRRLGKRDMRELLRIIGMNVYDLLVDEVRSPLVRGALAFDATLGANLGPRAPGTVLTWLSRLGQESVNGGVGLSQPAGGMGGLSAALGKSAMAAGVEIRTGARVGRVIVVDDKACGVELVSGERIDAKVVISNADPKTTFLKLLGAQYLDTGFVRKVHHSRARGVVAKLHLAVNRLPAFTGLAETALRGRILVSPTLDYLERAFDAPKYGAYSSAPALEITVPTLNDSSLAPAGQHVLSVLVECAPRDLRGGWDDAREQFTRMIIDQLDGLAPGLKASVVASELLTPVDIEARFGNQGGHWHHTELAFDQYYFVRPVPGAAQYATPVAGLYLCGAGAHPGGGVAGVAGRLAAQTVLGKAG